MDGSSDDDESERRARTLHVIRENAVSVAHRDLPPIPKGLEADAVTICLCYQYVEPVWNPKQHRAAISFIIDLAKKHDISGRGRCAPEGLNCTLTGGAAELRAFCYALREWDPIFQETDFKLTDGLAAKERFKAFSLRKVDELVNYGLEGQKAPSLQHHGGKHVEATEYHELMAKPNTVIIDVRNAYESAIGHFAPPPGGAELIDPKMRNSSDFPKWLNAPETKAKLQGKEVLMYCTGGIRCERATALLNQLTEATAGFETKGVSMVRGGIERYLKTFPEGGFWKGKNYLFDRRMEQVPEAKPAAELEREVESRCCRCRKPWACYRGQFLCGEVTCKVPVIVCTQCMVAAKAHSKDLRCPLCEEGYVAPKEAPDLIGQKRKLQLLAPESRAEPVAVKKARPSAPPALRLFLGKMPLCISLTTLKKKLKADIRVVDWITDRASGAFYGSAFVGMGTLSEAKKLVERAQTDRGIRLGPKKRGRGKRAKIRVAFAPVNATEVWPAAAFEQREFPPIGV
jgi:predicted sulfurtransferase